MGERGQILIKDTGVYLYTHWNGYGLKSILQKALKKKWRWNDTIYLTRIIFEVMIGEERGTETGFGIGTKMQLDLNYDLLEIDIINQKVSEFNQEWTFDEFIKAKFKEV